jgi:hypothetical protein
MPACSPQTTTDVHEVHYMFLHGGGAERRYIIVHIAGYRAAMPTVCIMGIAGNPITHIPTLLIW